MAKVQLGNVVVLDNPSPFLNPFQFELTFECIEELKEGEYWKDFITWSLFPVLKLLFVYEKVQCVTTAPVTDGDLSSILA